MQCGGQYHAVEHHKDTLAPCFRIETLFRVTLSHHPITLFAHLILRTDKEAEAAVLAVLRARFPSHLILGEEGGVSGDPDSDYLWCVDPLGECTAPHTLFLYSWH